MTIRLLVAALAIVGIPHTLGAAEDDNPLKNAKVGDYATYKVTTKVLGQTVPGTMTRTVTAKSDKEATIKTTASVERNGMKMDIPEQQLEKIDLTKPLDPTKLAAPKGLPADVEIKVEKGTEGKEKIKAIGKEYDCNWTNYTVKGKTPSFDFTADVKLWMSKDLSLGLVRMEMTLTLSGQKVEMTMELTESGNKQ